MEIRDLISLAQNVIHKVHIQDYHGANILFSSLLKELGTNHQEEITHNPELARLMNMLLQALENVDFVLVADFWSLFL